MFNSNVTRSEPHFAVNQVQTQAVIAKVGAEESHAHWKTQ